MERVSNFAAGSGGGIKLPIGYRFHPTDEELIVHYLRRKAFGIPLPASVIPELDVFQTDPWNLPGDVKEKRYFFGRRKGSETGNSNKRIAACSGYWKPIGKGRLIVASTNNQAVGIRKRLVFCEGKHSNKTKTQWVMHEYSLVGSPLLLPSTIQASKMNLGDWVVYTVFQRRRRPRKNRLNSQQSKINITNSSVIVYSTMEEENLDAGPPQPCTPCSSGITDVFCNESLLDQEETSSFISVTCDGTRKT